MEMPRYAWQILDAEGRRKYVSPAEFRCFLHVTERMPRQVQAFCQLVAYAGCRISEGLNVCGYHLGRGEVVLRTLKRRQLVYRIVQIPEVLAELLKALADPSAPEQRLWSVDRSTAYRWIKRAMRHAFIIGRHACPKGLRHGYGTRNVLAGTPVNLIQKWMGHASVKSTTVYLDVVGAQERQFAEKTW
jgi:integrase/recombinase XerD